MKRSFLSIAAAGLLITGCAASGSSSETVVESAGNESVKSSVTAEWEGKKAELQDSEVTASADNKKILRVYVDFTNSTGEGAYLYESFAVNAYQNGTAINNATDINGDDANSILVIKDGNCLKCSYAFELNDESPVEVELLSPTADAVLLAKKTYELTLKS